LFRTRVDPVLAPRRSCVEQALTAPRDLRASDDRRRRSRRLCR
jgi:hypothetical protein